MADVQTLEALEARFAELERKVLGDSTGVERSYARNEKESEQSYAQNEKDTVVDLLADANASMRAALSGRDKVAAVVPRMGDLDRYLDPTFEDSLDSSSLVELLLSAEPELRERGRQLERLAELSPALDGDAMSGVPAHGERVRRLVLAGLERRELGDECCARVYALVDEYNAVVVNITKTLVQWDDALTQLELERRPKKVVE